MKIGILKEGKTPPDERVPLSPTQCKEITQCFPSISLVVQSSAIRRFSDEEYVDQGVEVVSDLSDCDVLLGVKEVPVNDLMPNKTYLYFSHTIKKQIYNRNLLIEMIHKKIRMVDYEALTDASGVRLIGFGKYAGIVGCYNTFYAYGQRTKLFDIKRAYLCADRNEMEQEFSKISLPQNFKLVITGDGRVSSGIVEVLTKLNIQHISADDFLKINFDKPVFTQLSVLDYNKRNDGKSFSKKDFYERPQEFESNFLPFAQVADMYITGHFWDNKAPFIFSRNDAKLPNFKIKVIGDVSCDIDGPIASTLRPSTIKEPLYGYNPITEKEVAFDDVDAITVMAVDNLPCELPKDASTDFGREFIDKVLPHLINDKEDVIKRATICEKGDLTSRYEYLRDFVKEESPVNLK